MIEASKTNRRVRRSSMLKDTYEAISVHCDIFGKAQAMLSTDADGSATSAFRTSRYGWYIGSG